MSSGVRRLAPGTLDEWLPPSILAAGFLARLYLAHLTFLNPDECLHYLLAVQLSLVDVYKATLTTAHPPLLIFLLYYWRGLGHSELVLRLPSVLAGTASCWFAFKWLENVAGRRTGTIGLFLLAFSPSLIDLSAEVRQYSLLLFFMAAALFLFDRAMACNSPRGMMLFSLALYGALLSHYSSLVFALSIGLYAVVRFFREERQVKVLAVWLAGQAAALALCGWLFISHIARVRSLGMPQEIADTWLRKSIFHAGEDSLLPFVLRETIRLFRYLFGNGLVGALGLCLGLAGVVWLLRNRRTLPQDSRLLALLLTLPFLITAMVSVAGFYPYGGTRHDVFLALFAIAAAAVGMAAWTPPRWWMTPLLLTVAVGIANWSPSPGGPYIRPRDQARGQMQQALLFVRPQPGRDSVIFTDYQSGLLLSYYLCGRSIVQFEGPFQPFQDATCGQTRIVVWQSPDWMFHAEEFPRILRDAEPAFALSGKRVMLFQAGWTVNAEPDFRQLLQHYGCPAPANFGNNILACEITVSGAAGDTTRH